MSCHGLTNTNALTSRSFLAQGTSSENQHLLNIWQDSMIKISIAATHLNCLVVFCAKHNFNWTSPSNYTTKYVNISLPFSSSITSLSRNLRQANQKFQAAQTSFPGQQDISLRLQSIFMPLRDDPIEMFLLAYPDEKRTLGHLFNTSSKSFTEAEQAFQNSLNMIEEIRFLLEYTYSADRKIRLEINDLKSSWTSFTKLVEALRKRNDDMRNNFVVQLQWIFDQLLTLGSQLSDNERLLILKLTVNKFFEIDGISMIIRMILKVYDTMSSKFLREQFGGFEELSIVNDLTRQGIELRNFRSQARSHVIETLQIASIEKKKFDNDEINRRLEFEQWIVNRF